MTDVGNKKKGNNQVMVFPFFCAGDEPKSELARDLGDRLQSRNAPFGASGDCFYLLISPKYR